MSVSPLAGTARFALNAKRVLAYLRHNGPLRGTRQLFGVYRQLHELRLGDFKGCDERGNEFYEDRLEPNRNRQRFVVYANSQRGTLHAHSQSHSQWNVPRSAHVCPIRLLVATAARTARDYDASDITPEWHGWLHRIYQETPIEVTSTHNHRRSLKRSWE